MKIKKILFLYYNQPQPLPVLMLNLLGSLGIYQVSLLYFDRINSPITIPLSGLLDGQQVSSVRWHAGNNPFSKVINRCIVFILFVKRIRDLRPDIIHAWNLEMLLYARIAALGLKHTQIVFTLQDTTRWMLSPVVKTIQRWIYRKVDLFFVTSEGFESGFLRRFHLIGEQKKIVFVPNVPPAAQFSSFKPRCPGDSITVGFIGTLRGEAGIRMLFEGVRLARKDKADIRILFAGTGRERDLVTRLAQENEFIQYLGPYRHNDQIWELYSRVDLIYALYDPSYDKKIHLAYRLCESVNCRLPIFVAKGTYMAEVVDSYGIGLAVELGDVRGLAADLKILSRSQELRTRISLDCEKARPQFVFEYYQARICQAYAILSAAMA
jgi:succinoglycan biosynthesis protein ExoL